MILESIQDLTLEQIKWSLDRAREIKAILKKQPMLKTVDTVATKKIVACTFFEEHSTRTKLSFMRALQILNADFINFDSGTSSLKKGESLRETFLTLKAMGINLCIMRSPVSFLLSNFKNAPPFHLINAGDGINEHPTQAILDLFTLLEEMGDLHGKTLAIVGDCVHSRVCHSLSLLLPLFGMKIILVGPKLFLPSAIPAAGVEISTSLDDAIERSDALYLLRIQTERHQQKGDNHFLTDYVHNYGVNLKKLKAKNKSMPLYSPGPANIGVEIDEEAINSPLFRGHTQVENGVYIRMSIIEAMFL